MLSRMLAVGLLSGVPALGALGAPSAGEEAPVATLADGRLGKIHFESRTPAGYFALARREAARKAVVFGTLRLPATGDRVPAMVIAHGSAGVDARETAWADRLTALGLATFVVDSFTPRGVRQTATDQSQLPTAANVADALVALRLLATHPRIDPDRIGVIGFSKGGQVALYTDANAYHDFDSDRSPRFARELVTGRGCDMAVDLDHFTVKRRGSGEDITASAGRYGRDCLARGATFGGDGEARRRAPQDVAAFLRRVFGL